jgi:hypothetical protein
VASDVILFGLLVLVLLVFVPCSMLGGLCWWQTRQHAWCAMCCVVVLGAGLSSGHVMVLGEHEELGKSTKEPGVLLHLCNKVSGTLVC